MPNDFPVLCLDSGAVSIFCMEKWKVSQTNIAVECSSNVYRFSCFVFPPKEIKPKHWQHAVLYTIHSSMHYRCSSNVHRFVFCWLWVFGLTINESCISNKSLNKHNERIKIKNGFTHLHVLIQWRWNDTRFQSMDSWSSTWPLRPNVLGEH